MFAQTNSSLAKYVNPFIGTGGTGHTFPGAVLPFGMVQLSPDTRIDGSWEGCSGYHYSDNLIYGFSHTHLSGTGVSDYGDILVMPSVEKPNLKSKTYDSKFSHQNEFASAGYYSVLLDDDSVKAELTTTTRVGIHRYTYPNSKQAYLTLDLFHRDKTLKSYAELQDSVTIVGYRVSDAWAREQHVYFVIKLNKPIIEDEFTQITENTNSFSSSINKKTHGGVFKINLKDNNELILKVGISQTSIAGALKNLNAEAAHWNFDLYKKQAEQAWEKELKKIEISSQNEEQLKIFYTALYHCMIHPSVASDVDGNYRGRDQKIYQANGFTPYTVFSLWDTFRALHPLFTIIDQKRTSDFLNTFLVQFEQSGRLPMWELSANETNCMIGFHSVSVIADAMAKKISKTNYPALYKAMQQAAEYNDFSIPEFNAKNYLQIDDESESVSKTLEYAYDNWCIAQVAKQLNKTLDYKKYMKRSLAFVNLYDSQTGFMRPRKNGNWYSPFEPREVNNHYTEANSWQYSFFVPQHISKLISLHGGNKKFEQKLDELFSTSSKTMGREQVDITGLIGQYAHGNEPSHHMAYLYNYVNSPIKAQEKINDILTNFYQNNPDGLIGNEDCGQMSAWYVFSSIGLYPVIPGAPEYALGVSLYDTVKINLESGKQFILQKDKISTSGTNYSVSHLLNGKLRECSFLPHESIMSNGKLTFNMQTKNHGENLLAKRKVEKIKKTSEYIAAPIINASETVFDKKTSVSIENIAINGKAFYTLDGKEPNYKSTVYTKKFEIDSSVTVKAIVYTKSDSSSISTSRLYKRPNNWTIHIVSNYNKQYTAGGDRGLIDGLKGTKNWRSGGWQGYQGQDFECIIDLQNQQTIQSITSGYLQDTQAWIIFPKTVEYYISSDGLNYNLFKTIENGISADDYSIQKRLFTGFAQQQTSARYIKVIAKNFGTLPEWHQGKGNEAFIFIDEIEVK
jgi:predicted alpha-1,2-mannosidase